MNRMVSKKGTIIHIDLRDFLGQFVRYIGREILEWFCREIEVYIYMHVRIKRIKTSNNQ
jgi:hypothetical protein